MRDHYRSVTPGRKLAGTEEVPLEDVQPGGVDDPVGQYAVHGAVNVHRVRARQQRDLVEAAHQVAGWREVVERRTRQVIAEVRHPLAAEGEDTDRDVDIPQWTSASIAEGQRSGFTADQVGFQSLKEQSSVALTVLTLVQRRR